MRRKQSGNIMLFWVGMGILIATAAANACYTLQLADPRQLYEGIRTGWQKAGESRFYAGIRVIPVRLVQTAAVLKICKSKIRQMGARMVLLCGGCSVGAALVLMSRVRGLFGIVPFLASKFPQAFCYLAAWGLYLYAGLEGLPDQEWKLRTVVLFLVFGGIFLEICAAPQLAVKIL